MKVDTYHEDWFLYEILEKAYNLKDCYLDRTVFAVINEKEEYLQFFSWNPEILVLAGDQSTIRRFQIDRSAFRMSTQDACITRTRLEPNARFSRVMKNRHSWHLLNLAKGLLT